MKKLFSFLLALCMTISLAACGQQVGSGGTSSTAGSGASGSTQGGSDWPIRPVNITVAASAGGATDILVRMYGQKPGGHRSTAGRDQHFGCQRLCDGKYGLSGRL